MQQYRLITVSLPRSMIRSKRSQFSFRGVGLCGNKVRAIATLGANTAVVTSTSLNNINQSFEFRMNEKKSWSGYAYSLVLGSVALAFGFSNPSISLAESSSKPSSHPDPTPVSTRTEELFEDEVCTIDKLPAYTSKQVSENNGTDGKPIWMTYGGVVYDVTNFIYNHPGGTERIMLAAGSAVEPHWHLYRQHFASDLPMRLMEDMIIGRLTPEDQRTIDEQMEKISLETEDPYAHEPKRSSDLIVHSDQPMNAETPEKYLTESYITPTDIFYIRHHHPVPLILQDDLENYTLDIDVSSFVNGGIISLTLDQIKKLPKVEFDATLQCSGNRRGDMNKHQRTSGTAWGQGAVSTARWAGARLLDVLKLAGLDDPFVVANRGGTEKHVCFESLDGMHASIGMEKATNPYGDVIIAYEMNGKPITRDHGFPLRVIVPGYAAVRNVKWLKKIRLSETESEGVWQRGLNYKTLPPNITDANAVNLEAMPSMTEASVFSGITNVEVVSSGITSNPGDIVMVKAKGWAWAGGGRNIVRVDVTGTAGNTWTTATITHGKDQKFGRAWAWVFWEVELPALVDEDKKIKIASKAVDLSFNSQPNSVEQLWNVRGLGNNTWYRKEIVI